MVFIRSAEDSIAPGSFTVTSCFCFLPMLRPTPLLSWNKKKQHESVLCFGPCCVYCTLKIPLCSVDTRPDVFTWHLERLAAEPLPSVCSGQRIVKVLSCEVPHSHAGRGSDLVWVEVTTLLQSCVGLSPRFSFGKITTRFWLMCKGLLFETKEMLFNRKNSV